MKKIKFDKSKINEYDKEQLEVLKSKEKSYQESGEVLLESMLKLPFKNKNKLDELLLKITNHKKNISLILDKIDELENKNNHNFLVCGFDISQQRKNYIETVVVNYMNSDNEVENINVIDDVFQSVLGNYYLVDVNGFHLSLNRVIGIDEESSVGRWYNSMCKDFERGSKLKRILKDK